MREAIILAGGLGTRLSKVVTDRPKPMADIAGRPFLEWQLLALAEQGVTHVVLAVSHMRDLIKHHFGKRFANVDISYSVEEQPLGTGGAIVQALQVTRSEVVFALNGDSISGYPLAAMEQVLTSRASERFELCIGVTHLNDASRYGSVLWNSDSNRQVSGFTEKGQQGPGWISVGLYLLRRDCAFLPAAGQRASFEVDVLQKCVPLGQTCAVDCGSTFLDIGVPEDYQRAQTYIPEILQTRLARSL